MIEKEISLKKIIIFLLLLIIIIFTFIQIKNTFARYETNTSTARDVDVAFWILEDTFATSRLIIDDIYPRNDAFEYSFTVSNTNASGTRIADTDMEYYLVLTSTTFLPLNFEIIREGVTVASFNASDNTSPNIDQIITDDDGTKYVQLALGSATLPFKIDTVEDNQKRAIIDDFIIKVTFPKSYSTNDNYADLMEDVKLTISAQQIIEGE